MRTQAIDPIRAVTGLDPITAGRSLQRGVRELLLHEALAVVRLRGQRATIRVQSVVQYWLDCARSVGWIASWVVGVEAISRVVHPHERVVLRARLLVVLRRDAAWLGLRLRRHPLLAKGDVLRLGLLDLVLELLGLGQVGL